MRKRLAAIKLMAPVVCALVLVGCTHYYFKEYEGEVRLSKRLQVPYRLDVSVGGCNCDKKSSNFRDMSSGIRDAVTADLGRSLFVGPPAPDNHEILLLVELRNLTYHSRYNAVAFIPPFSLFSAMGLIPIVYHKSSVRASAKIMTRSGIIMGQWIASDEVNKGYGMFNRNFLQYVHDGGAGRVVIKRAMDDIKGQIESDLDRLYAEFRKQGIEVGPILTVEKSTWPPKLQASYEFQELSGNGILDAGETAKLTIHLRNGGRGEARSLRVSVVPDRQDSHLIAINPAEIELLKAGEDKKIVVELSADIGVRTQEIGYTIRISEAYGFDLDPPLKIRFQTQAFRPPQLAVADYAIDDFNDNRKVEKSEVVTITARLQNQGVGPADSVIANVSVGSNVFLAGDTKSKFDLGRLEPGEYEDIEFSLYTNNRATSMPATLTLSESHGRYGVTEELDLPFDAIQKQASEMVIAGTPTETITTTTAPDLVADVDRNIPSGAMSNPDAVAVIIGNSAYEDSGIPSVEFAINDAVVMREYMIKTLGYSPDNVLFYTDATLRDLNSVFGREGRPRGRLYDYVKPGISDVFVYYSGHGAPDSDSKQAYFLPSDCDGDDIVQTAYGRNTLFENLSQLSARSVTVILDACFSGGSDAGSLLGDMSPLVIDVEPSMTLVNGLVIASSANDQVSSWYREKKHGLFTYFFLKGLCGDADADGNRQVTVGEMEDYLTDPVNGVPYMARRLKGREQTPMTVTSDRDKVMVELK
jgi:hypothetical protein